MNFKLGLQSANLKAFQPKEIVSLAIKAKKKAIRKVIIRKYAEKNGLSLEMADMELWEKGVL